MERKRDSIPSDRAMKRGKVKIDDIESRELGPSFADLPLPITTDILLRLPTKPVLVCKHVCRTWNTLISDPHFAKLHFDRSRFGFMIRVYDLNVVSRTLYLLEDEPPELDSNCQNILKLEPTLQLPLRDRHLDLVERSDVVNSCNGLLCLRDPLNNDPIRVCNPVTGEFIRLPKVIKSSERTMCSGIGFHTKTNEYKVVRIAYGILNVEINVVGTPTWRNVRVDGNFSEIKWLNYPTSVNEALHWICCMADKYSILRFKFETEKLQLISLPFPSIFYHGDIRFGASRDSLYVCNTSFIPSASMDVWIMNNDDTGVLWTKAITLRRPKPSGCTGWDIHVSRSIKNFGNGYCILEYCSKKGFIYYDTKNRPTQFLVCGTEEKLLEVIPHIPSLISLKDVVKGDNVEVLNVNSQEGCVQSLNCRRNELKLF